MQDATSSGSDYQAGCKMIVDKVVILDNSINILYVA